MVSHYLAVTIIFTIIVEFKTYGRVMMYRIGFICQIESALDSDNGIGQIVWLSLTEILLDYSRHEFMCVKILFLRRNGI